MERVLSPKEIEKEYEKQQDFIAKYPWFDLPDSEKPWFPFLAGDKIEDISGNGNHRELCEVKR